MTDAHPPSDDHAPADHPAAEHLLAHADGETDATSAATERHVAGCRECAREVQRLRASGQVIASLARFDGPPDLAARVLAAARTGAPTAERAARDASAEPARAAGAVPAPQIRRLPVWRYAAAAALLTAAVLGARQFAATPSASEPVELTAAEEEAIARDLFLLANLEALETADPDELRDLVEDLDVLESLMLEEQEG